MGMTLRIKANAAGVDPSVSVINATGFDCPSELPNKAAPGEVKIKAAVVDGVPGLRITVKPAGGSTKDVAVTVDAT